ncbi:MAG: BatD family protein [Roseibium sp.]|nr:BatD family protein [Roseibium sp.]
MMRVLLLLACLAIPLATHAQAQTEPVLRTDFEKTSAIPGQPLLFRVTVLVPTWMPKPPVFPSFEVPNVIVRLPSRASGPTSERIDGETWSGVSRLYRLYPIVPGTFEIPAGTIKVTYSDPESSQPVETEVSTNAFSLTGEIPDGAENLDPFLAAKSVKLERTVEGETENLAAGDALKITTRISVSGVSPMFVPPVTDQLAVDGLSVYPSDPVISEKEDRGLLSGQRTEVMSIVAEFAGDYALPELKLSWYNLDSGSVETVSAPAITFAVTGSTPDTPPEPEPMDWRSLVFQAALLILGVFLLVLLGRKLVPLVKENISRRQQAYLASEPHAFRQLKNSIDARSLDRVLRTFQIWHQFYASPSANFDDRHFEAVLAAIGSRHYSKSNGTDPKGADDNWQKLTLEVQTLRHDLLKNKRTVRQRPLPELNPSSQG